MASNWKRARTKLLAYAIAASGVALTPHPALSQNQVLESAKGDRIAVILGAQAPQAQPSVKLCLLDAAPGAQVKAFDIRAAPAPRFWTNKHAPLVCAHVSSTLHIVSFFAGASRSGLREILRARLNLGGLSGRRVNMIWAASKQRPSD